MKTIAALQYQFRHGDWFPGTAGGYSSSAGQHVAGAGYVVASVAYAAVVKPITANGGPPLEMEEDTGQGEAIRAATAYCNSDGSRKASGKAGRAASFG
ncbi:MAG: hypothetical protein ACTHKB_06095 [Burkholderiaceae bacterium]